MTPAVPPTAGHRLLLLLAAAAPLTGCVVVQEPPTGDLFVTAVWQPWQDDNLPHLVLTLQNRGGGPVAVGPGETPLRVNGPSGDVPLAWGEVFARTLGAGETVVLALHPRLVEGRYTLAIDHAAGQGMVPLPGLYFVCAGDRCTRAMLGT